VKSAAAWRRVSACAGPVSWSCRWAECASLSSSGGMAWGVRSEMAKLNSARFGGKRRTHSEDPVQDAPPELVRDAETARPLRAHRLCLVQPLLRLRRLSRLPLVPLRLRRDARQLFVFGRRPLPRRSGRPFRLRAATLRTVERPLFVLCIRTVILQQRTKERVFAPPHALPLHKDRQPPLRVLPRAVAPRPRREPRHRRREARPGRERVVGRHVRGVQGLAGRVRAGRLRRGGGRERAVRRAVGGGAWRPGFAGIVCWWDVWIGELR
jgi:hypothetical protein